jgi:hypothetical protein
MNYLYSQHALKQMELRDIPEEMVDRVLSKPDQTVEKENLLVFQSIIKDLHEQYFLIRVFVNVNKTPPLVVTVYKTSKIEKYHEGKI